MLRRAFVDLHAGNLTGSGMGKPDKTVLNMA